MVMLLLTVIREMKKLLLLLITRRMLLKCFGGVTKGCVDGAKSQEARRGQVGLNRMEMSGRNTDQISASKV